MKFVSKAPATFALAVLLAGSALLSFVPTASATVIVPSTADIFLAGQSSVPANVNTGYAADAATNYNPGAAGLGLGTLPISISVFGGETLNLTATGTVSCCLGATPTNGPDGGGLKSRRIRHYNRLQHGGRDHDIA